MEERYSEAARIFKALADKHRVNILNMLIESEMYADKILEELDVSQPTLSHHMKILCDSGLVEARKDGRMVFYSISESGRDRAFDLLAEFTAKPEEAEKILEEKKPVARKKKDIVLL